MKRFCEKISRFLLDVDNVTEDEIDEVRFGIDLILTQMILFFFVVSNRHFQKYGTRNNNIYYCISWITDTCRRLSC